MYVVGENQILDPLAYICLDYESVSFPMSSQEENGYRQYQSLIVSIETLRLKVLGSLTCCKCSIESDKRQKKKLCKGQLERELLC